MNGELLFICGGILHDVAIQWTVNKHAKEVKALDYSKVFGQNGKLGFEPFIAQLPTFFPRPFDHIVRGNVTGVDWEL